MKRSRRGSHLYFALVQKIYKSYAFDAFFFAYQWNLIIEAVGVEPGISNDSYTEISDGPLSEGDEIVTEYSFSGKDSKSPGFALPQPKRF